MLNLQEPQEPITISQRYRLLERLRQGGMSEVYLAVDEQRQRQVALKLVHASTDTDCLKRLQREIRILRSFSHPSILPVLDDGEFEGYHYLVMPYMKRGNLRERLMRGRLTQEEAGVIMGQLADALSYAHARDIVHRDIKPSNVLLDDEDEQRVYLADFGLAKTLDGGSDITQTGMLIGTPEYMAPELAEQPESVSSDIYALGILLYNMLTGRLPFTGTTPLAIYWKHIQEVPLPPSSHNPALSPEIEAVILHALEKDPIHRFTSTQAMKQAYDEALQGHLELTDMRTLLLASVELRRLRGHAPVRARVVLQKGAAAVAAFVLLVLPLSLGFMLAPHPSASVPGTGARALTPAIHLLRVLPPGNNVHTPPALNAAGGSQVELYSRPVSVHLPPPVKSSERKGHNHKHGDGGGD